MKRNPIHPDPSLILELHDALLHPKRILVINQEGIGTLIQFDRKRSYEK